MLDKRLTISLKEAVTTTVGEEHTNFRGGVGNKYGFSQ